MYAIQNNSLFLGRWKERPYYKRLLEAAQFIDCLKLLHKVANLPLLCLQEGDYVGKSQTSLTLRLS